MTTSDNENKKSGQVPPAFGPFGRLPSRQRAELLGLVRRGISRRDFLSSMSAAGMTAAAAGSLFVGARTAHAETAAKGGTVRCALSDYGTDTMDPRLFSSTGDRGGREISDQLLRWIA